MATVKGDVHDIGKNIVAVVLGCNNFKVYDLGVMVSCEVILEKAKEYNVDVIGLSGLITPSLDEMVVVAKELSKRGYKQPLLIGGATTSKMHTAVKIAPNYFTAEHPTIHVLDASRSVTVVSSLLGANKQDFVEDLQEEYEEMREDYYAGLDDRNFLILEDAKKAKFAIDFDAVPPAPVPNKLGITVFDSVKVADIVPYIDWVSLNRSRRRITTDYSCFIVQLTVAFRIHSSKPGNFEDDTPIAATQRFLTTKLSVPKRRSFSTMLKSC